MPQVDFGKVKQDRVRELVETHGWPEPLAEAGADDQPHRGTLRLNWGELISFSRAEPCGRDREWVRVDAVSPCAGEIAGHSVVVRVSAIIWCVDRGRA
jgi:hypothetical protein